MSDTPRNDFVTIRVEQALADRLDRLRREKHLNVSSFAREALIAALDRDFPAPLDSESLSRAVSRS